MSDFDKKLYRERREKGLRGQIGYANVVQRTEDEKGNPVLVAVGFMRGPGISSRMRSHRGESPKDRKFSTRGAQHPVKEFVHPEPTFPPEASNHERMKARNSWRKHLVK